MKKLLSAKINKSLIRVLSCILTIALLFSITVIPSTISSTAALLDERTFGFEDSEGTVYGSGATMNDSKGTLRTVSGAGFSKAQSIENNVLSLKDERAARNARDTYFVFNGNAGLYELKASSSYVVSLRFKVNSKQVSFKYNNIEYPVSSQKTFVKLAYGLTSKTEIGDIALLTTGGNTFTRVNEKGETETLPIGQWHELEFRFTTPDSFADGDNFVLLNAKTFNGIDIEFDDVYIAKIPSIKLVTTKGTLEKSVIPVVIGEKIDLPNPRLAKSESDYTYAGTDFNGWYLDSACTIPFTDEYATVENCEKTLYAGFSTEHFGFESFSKVSQYGAPNYFFDIVDNPEEAHSGRRYVHYHYTEEVWTQPYSGGPSTLQSRRTASENSIGIKKLQPSTTYVFTFKYRFLEGSDSINVSVGRAGTNIWWSGAYFTLAQQITIPNDNSGEWKEYRATFTTPEDLRGGSDGQFNSNVLYLMLHATNHAYTEVYVDDAVVKEVKGDTEITLNANGGTFDGGKTTITQKATLGDEISGFPFPTRDEYDFAGWAYDVNGVNMVTAEEVDADVYDNTLYAIWSRNMGFEGYYYDLESADRNNYISDTVSIVKGNAKRGFYSAKLSANGGAQNVIAMNPINNKTRYLVTFYYDLKSAAGDVNVQFATMGYNINDNSEANKYDAAYTISKDDAGKGYKMGAVIIETEFKTIDANRLAMLVSGTAGDYTVYFDCIELNTLTVNDGYVLLNNTLTGDYKVLIGKNGETVKPEATDSDSDKFIGWYTDAALTDMYDNDATYSAEYNVIYAGFIGGEDYKNYTVNGTNTAVVSEKGNKYLKLSKNATEKVYTTTASKRYAVEFSYRVEAITADTTLTVGNATVNLPVSSLGTVWNKHYMVITADSDVLNISVDGNDSFAMGIDNLIVYEITDKMSVITFNQKDGYGEDTVRVGVKGMEIAMPDVAGVGNEVFYGWYKDTTLKTPFVSKVYPDSDITLYGRWATNPKTSFNFNDSTLSTYFTDKNTANAYLTGSSTELDLCFDRISEEENYENYAPLVNKNGYYKLQSNTTYAVKFNFLIKSYTSGATMTINFFVDSSDSFTKGNALGTNKELKYAYAFRTEYFYFTTGDLAEGEDTLYMYVQKGTKKSTLLIDDVTITRVDEGRNHAFLVDPKNTSVIYEVDGNYGAEIAYPNINDKNYEVEGWYYDFETTQLHASNLHNEEPVTVLYIRWDLQTITFDNYLYEKGNKYTVGDDISLSAEEQYDTTRSLKYSYSYAIKYFETSKNTAGMGRVIDDSTYKITFRYKITAAQGDVDIKFLTAHQTNRWAFITNYDEATYRIYSSEIGSGWQEATVYLTTDFYSIGTSGLFFTFNPVVEGETVVYIDAVDIKTVREPAVAAFVGKDGAAVHYVEGNVGDTVTAPAVPPSQFATFNGWYSDKECTESFSSMELGEGINYIYSGWTDRNESFDNYTYASNDSNNFAVDSVIENGQITVTASEKGLNGFRVGKVENNTTYKVTVKYKTTAKANLKFATADEMSFYSNSTLYNDEGNCISLVSDGEENTATAYITTAFTYSVPKSNADALQNKDAVYGDMLYIYFDNAVGSSVTVTDVNVREISVLTSNGTSVLTEAASKEIGKQALRFYFSYQTSDIMTIDVDGESFTIVERGMVFKNAKNTTTGKVNGNMITVEPIILENKNDKGYISISKTSGFNQYWDYDNKTESLIFSGYIKDFGLEDTRLIGGRGYIKVKDADGNIYTFYSADKKTTVKEGVDINSEYTDKEVHTFADVSWDNFTIVHPKLMPYIYGREIERLIDYAKNTHGVTLNRVTEKIDETPYEIVIGDTKRDASNLVTVENEDQYVIAVRGTKVIIKGGSDLAVMQGVKDFVSYLKMKDGLDCGADLVDGYTAYGTISTTMDDYKLTFYDEFDASTVDTSKWGSYTSQDKAHNYKTDSNLGGYCYTYSVGEGGYTTATGRVVENAVDIRDGNIVLSTARLDDNNFSKTEISTFWNLMYQYGYLEINCKLGEPPSHVGWWINGANIPSIYPREARGCMTEYDLIENYGRMNYYATAIHNWWGSNSIKDTGHVSIPDSYGIGESANYYVPDSDETSMYDDYHILTFLWENDRLIFALDGIKYYEYVSYEYYKERMANYIILSAGMGNRDYGVAYDINKHNDYYESLIDYVRLYQNEGMGSRIVWAQ